jgi:hypothetical protein
MKASIGIVMRFKLFYTAMRSEGGFSLAVAADNQSLAFST